MKISIINENEIFLNYLITDTSEEMNIPSLNDGYSLMYGNDENNLKTITVDNLKKIFHENKQKYTIYINSLNFDKLTFDVTAYDKGNELINDYDFSNNFIFSEDSLINNDLKISLLKNIDVITNNIVLKSFLQSIHNNVMKVVREFNSKNNITIESLIEKSNDYLITNKDFKDPDYIEPVDDNIEYLNIDDFCLNLPELSSFIINDISFPDLSTFSINVSFKLNEFKTDASLNYSIKNLEVPELLNDLINEFSSYDNLTTNFDKLIIPDLSNLKIDDLNSITVSKDLFNQLNIPDLSDLKFNNLNIPSVPSISIDPINIPNFSAEMINSISIPNTDGIFREINFQFNLIDDFNKINFSSIFFDDLKVPEISDDMFDKLIINDIEYSLNILNIPEVNCSIKTINFPDFKFIDLECDENFNDVNDSIKLLSVPNVNFKSVEIPNISLNMFDNLNVNNIELPTISYTLNEFHAPLIPNITLNDINLPKFPEFSLRVFNVSSIGDELINKIEIPNIDDNLNVLEVPTTDKIIKDIEIPDLPTTDFKDPEYEGYLNETINKIKYPKYDDVETNFEKIEIPSFPVNAFDELIINDINYPKIEEIETGELKFPEIKLDVSLDTLPFYYEFPILTHTKISFNELDEKLNLLNNRLENVKFRVCIKFSCFDAINANDLEIDKILLDGEEIYDSVNNLNEDEVSISTKTDNETNKTIQYYYTVSTKALLNFNIKIEKVNYHPFKAYINLEDYYKYKFKENNIVYIEIDLGNFPLLSMTKTNGIVLSWNQFPHDLDAYLINPSKDEKSVTSYENRETNFSMVDIDATESYGPETVSINYWTDLDAEYYDDNKINTTFKYSVKWNKDGLSGGVAIPINSMNATVRFFIDPLHTKTIIFDKDQDTQNRLGQYWRVFELDVLSKYGRHSVPQENLITATYNNLSALYDPKYYNINEEYISFKRFYHNLMGSYNFIVKVFDTSKNVDVSDKFEWLLFQKDKSTSSYESLYSYYYMNVKNDVSYFEIKNSTNQNINGKYYKQETVYNDRFVFFNGTYYIFYYNRYWYIDKSLNSNPKYRGPYSYYGEYNYIGGRYTNQSNTNDVFDLSFFSEYVNYDGSSFYDGNQKIKNPSNLEIKFYLNDLHVTKNLIYRSFKLSDISSKSVYYDSYYDEDGYYHEEHFSCSYGIDWTLLFKDMMIPFVMYDLNNNIINDVKYRYDYNNERVYIEILNRKHKLKEVKQFEYILGISHVFNKNELLDKDGNKYDKRIEDISFYTYLDKINLSKNVRIEKLTDNKVHIYGIFNFKEKNTNITLARPKLFEIHPVAEIENVKNANLINELLHENEVFVDVNNFSITDSESLIPYYNLKISKVTGDLIPAEMTDELKPGQLLEKTVNLIRIIDKSTGSDISFSSFSWGNDGLKIKSFESMISNRSVSLVFSYNYFILDKFSYLGYEDNEENKEIFPFIYISENDNRISTHDYIFTCHPKDVRIFFKGYVNKNSTYKIKIVDYLKMYEFKYYVLNYFDKNLTINFKIHNYDDYKLNENNEYVLDELSRQKIGNINFNFNERDVRRNDDTFVLRASRAEPSEEYYYGKAISNYSYNLKNDNIRCDWDYIASFDTIYKHNNYYDYISLYSDTSSKPTHVNKWQDETITYNLIYPLVNFYGWFVDSNGKSFAELSEIFTFLELLERYVDSTEYINDFRHEIYKAYEEKEVNKLRCRMVNQDPALSSDLIYNYSLLYQYIHTDQNYGYGSSDKKFDGGTQVGRPTQGYYGYYRYGYKEEYTNFYNFFFKQKFDGDKTVPDDDFGASDYGNRGTRHAIVPGIYTMELYYNDDDKNPLLKIKDMDLTKENEERRKTYNVRIEYPLVNFTGYIINRHSELKEFRKDVEIVLTSKTNSNSTIPNVNKINNIPGKYIFKYGNFEYCYEEYEDDNENSYDYESYRTNNKFAFLFQGFDFYTGYSWSLNRYDESLSSYLYYQYGSNYYYSKTLNICAESAIPADTYVLEVRYKKDGISNETLNDSSIPDNEKYDIFYRDENFVINKEREKSGELYNYEIESPFINFNGRLYENVINSSNNKNENILFGNVDQSKYTCDSVISGNNWHIIMENKTDITKSVKFSYDEYGYKTDFEFRGFGRIREVYYDYYDIYPSGYFSKGLLSGYYDIIIKYKDKEVKRINNILINKENENLGKYDNVKINVGNIYTNLSGHLIDGKFNDIVIDNQLISICEEDFTEDINDSIFQEEGYDEWGEYGFCWQWTVNGGRKILSKDTVIYEFSNLKRIGQYATLIYDDYDEYYGTIRGRSNQLKIKGIVQSKSANEVEGSSNFNLSSYTFDDYSMVSGSNIYIPVNSNDKAHKKYDLLSLKDVISSSKNLSYDIYLDYVKTKIPYIMYISRTDLNANDYYEIFDDFGIKVPFEITLTEQYDKNDCEHLKLAEGIVSGIQKFSWNHKITRGSYNSLNPYDSDNSTYGFRKSIKSGKYDLSIKILSTNIDLDYDLYFEDSRTPHVNDYLEVSSSKYNIRRKFRFPIDDFKTLKTALITKYYSLDKNDPKYQVIKIDYSNYFSADLKYSEDNVNWHPLYDFNSATKNAEIDNDNYYRGKFLATAMFDGNYWNNYVPEVRENYPIKFINNLVTFDQLHKDLYVKFDSIKLYNMDTEIVGIFDDIDLNGDLRDESILNELVPMFEDDTGKISTISGHVSDLITEEYYYDYDDEDWDNEDYEFYDVNTLKYHLLSGDFLRTNNLLDENNSFKVSSISNGSKIKLLELGYINVTIKGKLRKNDPNNPDGVEFDMYNNMRIRIELYRYDDENDTETLVQDQYYRDNQFVFSNVKTGFYKFKFFLNNIEIFEKEKGKIHTFNYNENYHDIILENYFPTLSGEVFYNAYSTDEFYGEAIFLQGEMFNEYPNVVGTYVLTNNPKNKIDRIYKHLKNDLYIFALTDKNVNGYDSQGVSWVVSKFNNRCSYNDLNKNYKNNEIDSYYASYGNIDDDPVKSFEYSIYEYYHYIEDYDGEIYYHSYWEENYYYDNFSNFVSFINKADENVYLPSIDYVHVDLINKDLNDVHYYGFASFIDSDEYTYSGKFYQNTGMNYDYGYYEDYKTYLLKDVLEGNYKIKYFIFPDGAPQYYHWSYRNLTDVRSNYIELNETNNSIGKKLKTDIMNILSGNVSSNEIKISTNDFYSMINSVSFDQLKEQFYKSENLRIFRIQMNYRIRDYYFNSNGNETYSDHYGFSLIKFEDIFPAGGLYNNLSDDKFITIKILSKFENIIPKKTTNIDWNEIEIRSLILSWADLIDECEITIDKDTKTIGDKILKYMYTYSTNITCQGYNTELHNNSKVHTKVYENDEFVTSGGFSGTNKTMTYYGLRTNTPYYYTYNRSEFILGDTSTEQLCYRTNNVIINTNKLYNLSGNILNGSIEKSKNVSNISLICKQSDLIMKSNYRIDYRFIYKGDGTENSSSEIGVYYSGSYDGCYDDWRPDYSYNFGSLLSGRYDFRYRAEAWNYEHVTFNGNWEDNSDINALSTVYISGNNFDLCKDIEIPYINIPVTLQIFDNKSESYLNLNYIQPSSIILKRKTEDGFDKTFTNRSGYSTFNVRSGYYDTIEVKCTISGTTIDEAFFSTVINEERVFKVYRNYALVNIEFEVLKDNKPQGNVPVFIFDENKNLKDILTTNSTGTINATLKNIPYYFKAISQDNEFIEQQKLDNAVKKITLSY